MTGNLYGGNEPARTWFTAMKPIATNFGDVKMPPTDPRYVDGAPGSQVPSVAGLDVDLARQRLKEAGFQVADQANSVNSSASMARWSEPHPTAKRSRVDHHHPDQQRHPAAPPPPPEGFPEVRRRCGSQVIEIPGLPPITIPILAPPPP